MAVAGVIAEYNVFHRGHAWQLRALRRRLGPDTAVVAAMSGSVVQRGEFAVASKHARAEMALEGGVDLVLEIPAPWACATAERFAQGGAAVLAATGVVTHLVFGSESADLEKLRRTAECLDSDGYRAALRLSLAGGVTFAQAREAAARSLVGEAASVLARANDNLAVEYLRALAALDWPVEPVALPRVGAGHDSGGLGTYASASAIRALLLSGGPWRDYVPETTVRRLERDLEEGRAPVTLAACQRAVLSRLRRMEAEEFIAYDGGGEGLYRRFYAAVRASSTVEELLERAKTRRYTMARLRRLLLHSYLDLRPAGREDRIPYLRVLGASGRGRALLRQMGKTAALPVVTRPGRTGALGEEAAALMALEARCTDLAILARPDYTRFPPGEEYRIGPVMR